MQKPPHFYEKAFLLAGRSASRQKQSRVTGQPTKESLALQSRRRQAQADQPAPTFQNIKSLV
jgi:hypothetical protein